MHGTGLRKIEYEIACRKPKRLKKTKQVFCTLMILTSWLILPFMITQTSFEDLIKYDINPFYNPRIAVPRLFRGRSIRYEFAGSLLWR